MLIVYPNYNKLFIYRPQLFLYRLLCLFLVILHNLDDRLLIKLLNEILLPTRMDY